MPTRNTTTTHIVPIKSVAAQATSTTATALAIPVNCRAIELVGSTVKHWVAVGSAASAPDLSASNAGILQVSSANGFAPMTIYPRPGQHLYLYLEAASATGAVDVTYYA